MGNFILGFLLGFIIAIVLFSPANLNLFDKLKQYLNSKRGCSNCAFRRGGVNTITGEMNEPCNRCKRKYLDFYTEKGHKRPPRG